MSLSAEEAREILDYSPEAGTFTWKIRPANRMRVGDEAGAPNGQGYRYIRIKGRQYRANRLAWLMTHGKWPEGQVDHIDGNKFNDRIGNLRDCSNAENCQNRSHAKGAYKNPKGGYSSVVTVRGKRHYLGKFSSEEMARAAYVEAKARLHPFQNIDNIA